MHPNLVLALRLPVAPIVLIGGCSLLLHSNRSESIRSLTGLGRLRKPSQRDLEDYFA